jgi:hypothetical protein
MVCKSGGAQRHPRLDRGEAALPCCRGGQAEAEASRRSGLYLSCHRTALRGRCAFAFRPSGRPIVAGGAARLCEPATGKSCGEAASLLLAGRSGGVSPERSYLPAAREPPNHPGPTPCCLQAGPAPEASASCLSRLHDAPLPPRAQERLSCACAHTIAHIFVNPYRTTRDAPFPIPYIPLLCAPARHALALVVARGFPGQAGARRVRGFNVMVPRWSSVRLQKSGQSRSAAVVTSVHHGWRSWSARRGSSHGPSTSTVR